MQGIQDFIRAHGVSIEDITRVDAPDPPSQWDRAASHWMVTIVREGTPARMLVPFHMGSAHAGPPCLADVLDCMASDSSGYENAEHEYVAWVHEFRRDAHVWNEDTEQWDRTDGATFDQVERQATELREFLGEDAYESLLWQTERE